METNNNVNKCINKKKITAIPLLPQQGKLRKVNWTQFAVETNTSSKAGKIFRGDNVSLAPKIKWSSSHAVSSSRNDSFDSSSLLGNRTLISHFPLRLSLFFFFLLLLKVRQFEAERLTWLNFSLIEVRRESSSFCHLTHCNTKLFAPSPSSSVCSMVLSVQVITFEYRYGRQDHGTFGYRIPRLWICKNNTPPTGLSSLRLLWLHYQSFLRKLTQSVIFVIFVINAQLSEHSPFLLSYDSPGYKRVCGKKWNMIS